MVLLRLLLPLRERQGTAENARTHARRLPLCLFAASLTTTLLAGQGRTGRGIPPHGIGTVAADAIDMPGLCACPSQLEEVRPLSSQV